MLVMIVVMIMMIVVVVVITRYSPPRHNHPMVGNQPPSCPPFPPLPNFLSSFLHPLDNTDFLSLSIMFSLKRLTKKKT